MNTDTSLAQHALQQNMISPRQLARANPGAVTMTDESARAAAVQFEALLVQTMLKSMRDASEGNQLFGSEQESLYTEMFDQHIATDIAGSNSLGLAESIYRQIAPSSQRGSTETSMNPLPARSATPAALPLQPSIATTDNHRSTDQMEFISAIRPAANATARQLGTTAEAVMAVAALETGWGQRMPRNPDGSQSNNLFGIKADNSWRGDVASAATQEYEDGQFIATDARFRSYRNSAESIADFGNFIRENPRYHKALQHAADPEQFIREIHSAGYATDPQYADKLMNILHRIGEIDNQVQI